MAGRKKILITGASGFIGSHLVDSALNHGYEVFAGIRQSSSREFLAREGIRFLEMDLSSEKKLNELFKNYNEKNVRFDVVIHNAGTTVEQRKGDFDLVNFHYTRNLVRSLENSDSVPGRFIVISSLAVYGPGDSLSFKPIIPGDVFAPLSAYGRSKVKVEEFLQRDSSLAFQIVQPAAVYGPRDRDFLSYFKMVKRHFEPMIGLNEQKLSMVYVKDLADGVLRLVSQPVKNRKYIVSDNGAYDKSELGRIIREYLKIKTVRLKVPVSLVLPVSYLLEKCYGIAGKRPYLNREKIIEISRSNWICDSSDFWDDIGSSPAVDLSNGLRQTADWYHEKGWL